MGLFNFFSGKKRIPATESERIQLVRSLLAKRLSRDPATQVLNLFGGRTAEANPESATFMGIRVGEIEPIMLMSMPEASIMRIVEQYYSAAENGAPDYVIIPFLNEAHSKALAAAGQLLPAMSQPFTMERYVEHFVASVHDPSLFDMAFIPEAIATVKAFYGRP
jgi:hypothetical protein